MWERWVFRSVVLASLLAATLVTFRVRPLVSSPAVVKPTVLPRPFIAGLAALRSEDTWCRASPFLPRDFDYAAAAESLIAARGRAIQIAHRTNWLAPGYGRFDGAPSAQTGCSLTTIGATQEDAKRICNLEALAEAEGCIIYSLGGGNQYSFEDAMVALTLCEIHVFDCTCDPIAGLHPRVIFHKLCVGAGDEGPLYRALDDVMAELQHTRIDLLKMDIEGFEFPVLEALWRVPQLQLLPHQIIVEFHWRTQLNAAMPWGELQHTRDTSPGLGTGDLTLIWTHLSDVGYVVVSRDNNPTCLHCCEFTLVRAFC